MGPIFHPFNHENEISDYKGMTWNSGWNFLYLLLCFCFILFYFISSIAIIVTWALPLCISIAYRFSLPFHFLHHGLHSVDLHYPVLPLFTFSMKRAHSHILTPQCFSNHWGVSPTCLLILSLQWCALSTLSKRKQKQTNKYDWGFMWGLITKSSERNSLNTAGMGKAC